MTDARVTRADLLVVADGDAGSEVRVTRADVAAITGGAGVEARVTRSALMVISDATDFVAAALPDFHHGIISYRLMVEGWPDEFVTDSRITHELYRDGREVHIGLMYEGLRLEERIIPQEARIEAPGINFKIVPQDIREKPLASFTKYPKPKFVLRGDMSASDPSFPTLQGGSPVDGTVYHLGTEALRYHPSGGIVRQIWDTQAQSHHVAPLDATRDVEVYDYPPAIEGRRAYLFAYGENDDPRGNGFCIWRGLVSRPPSLGRDGVSWTLECTSIVNILEQSVAGFLQEAHPVGVYLHALCGCYVEVGYLGSSHHEVVRGFFPTELDLMAAVVASFESCRSAVSCTKIVPYSIRLEKVSDSAWRVRFDTNATLVFGDFYIALLCPVLGSIDAIIGRWTRIDDTTIRNKFGDTLAANKGFFQDMDFDTSPLVVTQGLITGYGFPCAPLGNASAPLKADSAALVVDRSPSTLASYPPFRVYIDRDLTGIEAAAVTGTLLDQSPYSVVASGFDATAMQFFVEFAPLTGIISRGRRVSGLDFAFYGVLSAESSIVPVRNYVVDGDVSSFALGLIIKSLDANDGDTPFITGADFAVWTLDGIANQDVQRHRRYQFAKALKLSELLPEEFKLANHFPRLELDGRIGLRPIGGASETAVVAADHVIDDGTVITPADSYGMWPGWEPQRDGLVTAVDMATGYNPYKDSFDGQALSFQDPNSVATHKTRGKVSAKIEPKSALARDPAAVDGRQYLTIAQNYLAVFARDYGVVTLNVTFENFGCLCGDVVLITNDKVPAGDGTRGLVGRPGLVVGKRWNLDPRSEDMGQLDVRVERDPPAGYAPSGQVSGQTDLGSNRWQLTFNPAFGLNVLLSTAGDGLVTQHFWPGDFVRLFKKGATDESTDVLGNVITQDNIDTGVITIQFDSVWVPGSDIWIMDYQKDDAGGTKSTPHQKRFASVADDALLLPGGEFARDYS